MPRRPHVFTIAPSVPFLPTLAAAMVNGELIKGFAPRNDPLTLAGATVFLPTRRAARAFEYAILDALGTDTALLPRIVPLGDLDEDALAFSEDHPEEGLPAAVTVTERRLALAGIVSGFPELHAIGSAPATAIRLADQLARLFDDLTTARVSVEDLRDDDLPEHLDRFWQESVSFLKKAWKDWREHLAGIGKEDPAVRRDQLLARKAEGLSTRGGGPFIAAGSTGTIPAVADLLVAISQREDGAVILPGLDLHLDDSSFRMIGGIKQDGIEISASFGHPQFGLSRLLAKLGIARSEVRTLGAETMPEREKFLSEAFRPAESSDLWNSRESRIPDSAARGAVDAITLVEASDPREEALAAAIVLRESIERKKRAAFITHDRTLARRVAAELRRWEIHADDSAGVPLAESEAGRFARLTAAAAGEALAPVPLLAFLRHPMNRFSAARASIDALELAVLRGPRPAAGARGLVQTIEHVRVQKHHRRDPRAKFTPEQWSLALQLAQEISMALEPLLALAGKRDIPCSELVAAHWECLRRCGFDFAARDHGAPELKETLERLLEANPPFKLDLGEYSNAFAEMLRGEPPVRRPYDPEERIRILGPLEARLLQADQILIGGLHEGSWPPETHADAWLNRPLRKKLGLDLPERRIGLSAHDFVQALGTRDILLTRAKKRNGVETVASRFLQRIAAIAPPEEWSNARSRGENLLALSRKLENRISLERIQRPDPKPPAAIRPSQLSVTDIERLIRDPYSIYARDVLGLVPLEEIDADPGAAERGTIMHEAFAEFLRAFPQALPPGALDRLMASGRKAFAAIDDYPELRALWWPRFQRAAEWLAEQEEMLRQDNDRIFAETGGKIEFDAGGRPFTLTARADRIDRKKDGAASVYDYKTGSPPSLPQMMTGLAPQLPLEAAIAKAGGFAQLGAAKAIAGIFVLAISGGLPPGELLSFDPEAAKGKTKTTADNLRISTCDDLADRALEKTQELIRSFAKEETPFLSIPRPKWRGRFGEYDHLARIKEWSANEEGQE